MINVYLHTKFYTDIFFGHRDMAQKYKSKMVAAAILNIITSGIYWAVARAYRDCNPGVDFSIPEFGIGKMPIPGSRRDWCIIVWAITTAYGHGLLSSDHLFHL